MENLGYALVTGARGFLGRNIARRLHKEGYIVLAIGNGAWQGVDDATAHGIAKWHEGSVTLNALRSLTEGLPIALIVHCAGGGSVGASYANPMADFERTVSSTSNVLEFARLHAPGARVIYPSSAAIYGAQPDAPIAEGTASKPVSPYGVHKHMAEELCLSYARTFGTSVAILRFFSLYGPGLTKQLLWDACAKLSPPNARVTFSGTGFETRDWLHIDDACELVLAAARDNTPSLIINGGSGTRTEVLEALQLVSCSLDAILGGQREFSFDSVTKPGDPAHYWADMSTAKELLKWNPRMSLKNGIQQYVEWFIKEGTKC